MENLIAGPKRHFYIPAPDFIVTVNYDHPLELAISAGEYDDKDRIAELEFPSNRRGTWKVAVAIAFFNREMTSDDVLQEFHRQGFRGAEVRELLAWQVHHWSSHSAVSIVALGPGGAKPDSKRQVVYVENYHRPRGAVHNLRTSPWKDKWDSRFRFAAVMDIE
jgi:hypothetical protein